MYIQHADGKHEILSHVRCEERLPEIGVGKNITAIHAELLQDNERYSRFAVASTG